MQRKNNFKIKLLSVVIPAYKQEKTIVRDIKKIDKTLYSLKLKYEIIVVVDGLVDKTYHNALRLKSRKIKIIAYNENQGKGHAVRFGMMHAKGDIIGFIDAGMDIHPAGFNMLLNHMEWYNADAIVGSKLHPVSKVSYPLYRTILSWGYRTLTKMLFGFQVRDTQVGMKFFKRKVVRNVLPRLLVKRYAFDIEILAVTYALGYKRIYEAPIKINFKAATITSSTMWRTIYLMLWDTCAVFYRLRIMRYYEKKSAKKKMTTVGLVTEKDILPIKQSKKHASARFALTK
jgi:glycosyltransferase involved in cell wall biosynthesis